MEKIILLLVSIMSSNSVLVNWTQTSWDSADKFCSDIGRHLYTIQNLDELNSVTLKINISGDATFWIGGKERRKFFLWNNAQQKKKLVRLLVDGGTDVNYQGYDGKTALMIACSFISQSEKDKVIFFVKLLLDRGADPNLRDINGRTVLMHAFRYRASTSVVKILLNKGADPAIYDKKGFNAFCYIRTENSHAYAECFDRYFSPKQMLYGSPQDVSSFNLPVVMIDFTSPKHIAYDRKEIYFQFPSDIIQEREPNITRGKESTRHSKFGDLRRNSEGKCIALSELSIRNNHHLDIDMEMKRMTIHSKEDLQLSGKCKSSSTGDINDHEKRKSSIPEQRSKNKLVCLVSDADKIVFDKKLMNPPKKLPPIAKKIHSVNLVHH
ncbi:Hypothetical predicted protein [Mytilus galloprovincialis]|uniref:Uncharacterized protein n=1 Tax=Mytilus galloprovincialis TaxID=29158 RepID=A0A8B6C5R3_MYTGA|nr:Hypothetical predicted protein [Mytilus galloprovincialis]